MEAYQAEALRRLREYADAHSPFYQRFHRGLFDHPLHELPVLTKAILMEHFDEVVTDRSIRLEAVREFAAARVEGRRLLDRYWVTATSASSGQPGFFLFSEPEWLTIVASFARGYELNDSVRLAAEAPAPRNGGCPNGLPFAMLESIQGRVEDALHLPARSGGRVAVRPLMFNRVMDILPVSGWQIVQEADDRLTVRLSGARDGLVDAVLAGLTPENGGTQETFTLRYRAGYIELADSQMAGAPGYPTCMGQYPKDVSKRSVVMTLDTVRKTFTDWAPIYDATHAWTLPGRRAARLALGVQRGDRVLDIACGTGLNIPHLRELVGQEGYLIGIDVTPAMLDIARQRIARHEWKNVEVREADAARLPFPDASFDKAICAFAMNIIPDYVRAIAEAERVLVPGGRFVVLDVKMISSTLPRRLHGMPHICAVDLGHHTVDKLQRVFARVAVREYWAGCLYIAVATKR